VERFVPNTLQELMEIGQTALQSGRLGFPSHLLKFPRWLRVQ
jgi:hypothetical protein